MKSRRVRTTAATTMDACLTSQFEQQARAMAGLRAGWRRPAAPAVMLNILGDIWYESADTDAQRRPVGRRAVHAHRQAAPVRQARSARGHKMGHVTIVALTLAQAQADAASPRRWACRRRSRARPWLFLRPVQPRPRNAPAPPYLGRRGWRHFRLKPSTGWGRTRRTRRPWPRSTPPGAAVQPSCDRPYRAGQTCRTGPRRCRPARGC